MAGSPSAKGRVFGIGARILLVAGLFLGAIAGDAVAQSAGSMAGIPPSVLQQLSPDQLQQLLKAQKGGAEVVPPAAMPARTTLSPAEPAKPSPSRSSLEELMSKRAGTALSQFGYDQLGTGQPVTSALVGSVQDDYILGTGDQLDVALRGQENSDYLVTVDRNGQVTLPKLAPLEAAGLSFGDFRQKLEDAVHRAYISTQAYVSVTEVRQISVLVVGEVRNPGQQTLTGLSTVLDALNLAGGVKKSGSLRDIALVRGSHVIHLDLYAFLTTHKTTHDLAIAQGDRIIVPAIGPTVAVTGAVRRPAIYELAPGQRVISQRALMNLADGPVLPGVYRQMVLTIQETGKEELLDTTNLPGSVVRNGEILFVEPAVNYSSGKVTLEGPVRLPGAYALDKARTLHDLLPSIDAFEPNPYMLLGVIQRIDPKTMQTMIIPFSPARVVEGAENMSLVSNDVVRVLTVAQMRALASMGSSSLNENGDEGTTALSTKGASPASSASTETALPPAPSASTASVPASGPISTGNAGPQAQVSGGQTPTAQTAAASSLNDLSASESAFFGKALSDYHVTLTGAVREPGLYLIAPGTNLAELLAAAKGLDTDADVSRFEITSTEIDNLTGQSVTQRHTMTVLPSDYAKVLLHFRDNINFHHVYTDRVAGIGVTVSGQVRYPGTYSILRGERLSSVLVRAGGLTDVAYPYGTVFLRQSLAKEERVAHVRLAQDLQMQLTTQIAQASQSSGGSNSAATMAGIDSFITSIKDEPALGRMTVIADPSILAAHPQMDPMLEPGDKIIIPQRPSTVMVMGAVMQPGNYQFSAGRTVDDYIDQAGGYADGAEEDMVYVVYPDGRASRVDQSWLSFSSNAIPPGSTIYVPRDLFPINWRELTTTITGIFQNLAVSAASLAVISRNN